MKMGNVPGEFGFRALFYQDGGWCLTNKYFLTESEVRKHLNDYQYKWPIEVQENDVIYVPNEDELNG